MSVDSEKAFNKIQHPFPIKTPAKEKRRKPPQPGERHLPK